MKPSELPSTAILKKSLFGSVCPACGAAKRQRASLCFRCYSSLPRDLRSRLYAFIGHGYEEAMAAAMTLVHERTGRRQEFWPEPDIEEEIFPL